MIASSSRSGGRGRSARNRASSAENSSRPNNRAIPLPPPNSTPTYLIYRQGPKNLTGDRPVTPRRDLRVAGAGSRRFQGLVVGRVTRRERRAHGLRTIHLLQHAGSELRASSSDRSDRRAD